MTEEQEQTEEQGALIKTSVSLPKYLYDWIKESVKRKDFNSQSSLMITALSEMKGRLESKKEMLHNKKEEQKSPKQPIEIILEAYLQTEEGKAALKKILNHEKRVLFDKDDNYTEHYIID